MALEIGSIVEGKVTGVMNFGAFVALPGGRSGLVHISEITKDFVKDVHDHLHQGQIVKVMILNIAEDGKINLSIKRVQEELDRQERKRNQEETSRPVQTPTEQEIGVVTEPTKDLTFEEKLKKFMQASDSKNADKRRNTERKQHVSRR